ncbi:MAG: hypothetical protein WCI50_12215 [Actinomycetes bacterium]
MAEKPSKFEHHRYLGDKRTQRVYDLELLGDPEVAAAVADLMEAEAFAAFSPDVLSEARNRGYRPHRSIRSAQAASAEV